MYRCDEFLVRNEDGLPLIVAGGNEDILGNLKIDPFLNILDVNMEFRCWGRSGEGVNELQSSCGWP